jgi:hypothetical protein
MSHRNRQYQSNHHHRPHPRSHARAFVDSSSSSIINHSYHQRARQHSSSCTVSICYSYLIAILSSFLVVLGIYLALTKFNPRFLYISLTGLLIEAFSACIFCISTIHKSRLAQYKQTTDDVPALESEVVASRQQQARAVTHLLTNRTLNNQTAIRVTNDDNLDQTNVDTRPPIENCLVTKTQNQTIEPRLLAQDSSQINVQPSDIEAPSNCQAPPENADQTSGHATIDEQNELPSLGSEHAAVETNNDASQNTHIQCDRNESPESVNQALDNPQIDKPQTSANDDPDLNPAPPHASKRNPRPANVRRTLVMGLNGEEEVIEIDEQDLDEMSILPPPYESLLIDDNKSKQERQHQ